MRGFVFDKRRRRSRRLLLRWACVMLSSGSLASCHSQISRAPLPTAPAPALVAQGRLLPFLGSDTATQSNALAFGRFSIVTMIHGRPFEIVADHGSNGSLLTDPAIDRIGAPHWLSRADRVDTLLGGRAPAAGDSSPELTITRGDTAFRYWGVPEPAPLDSLRIGSMRLDSMFTLEFPAAAISPFDGLFGREILSMFDLFFDLPGHSIRLYQRSSAPRTGTPPAWLPAGLSPRNCISARVIPDSKFDTTTMDEFERQEARGIGLKRIVRQEQILMPMVLDGHPIDGEFDSGAGATSINWAEARALGITRDSPRVHVAREGGLRIIGVNGPSASGSPWPGYRDTTYEVTGLSLQIGAKRLPMDTVFIADPDFLDSPNAGTEPMVSLGLRHLRDQRLFLSYSAGFVCL